MDFKFFAEEAGTIPSAGICYVVGKIEEGSIKGGELATVEEMTDQSVSIQSVALINTTPPSFERVTLSIAEPEFPLDDLRGHRLIGKN